MPRIPDRQFFSASDYTPKFGNPNDFFSQQELTQNGGSGVIDKLLARQGIVFPATSYAGSQYDPNSAAAGNNYHKQDTRPRVAPTAVSPTTQPAAGEDPLGIYDTLLKMALAGSSAQYDIKGATRGVNAAYDPQFAYLDKLAASKRAAEKQNEADITGIFGMQAKETKKHSQNTTAQYLKQIGATQAQIDQRKAGANSQADQRIAEMTAELTKLGQDNLIADRKQQILNQRDQTLERIGAQGQSLLDNIGQMKGANQDWYNEAQDVGTSQRNVGIRDQKSLLVSALMNIDQSRAGLLSDRAKALSDISGQAASARAQSGPNINTILSILGQRNSLSKDLNSQKSTGNDALSKLIAQGGMNGAKAYGAANGLGDNYFNALSDFLTNQAGLDPSMNLQSGSSYKYDQLLQQYAKDKGLDPQQLMSMWQVYAKR